MKHISKLCGLALALAMTSASAAYGQVSESIDVTATITPGEAIALIGRPGSFGTISAPATGSCEYILSDLNGGAISGHPTSAGSVCETSGTAAFPSFLVTCEKSRVVNITFSLTNAEQVINDENLSFIYDYDASRLGSFLTEENLQDSFSRTCHDNAGSLNFSGRAELTISSDFIISESTLVNLGTITLEASY